VKYAIEIEKKYIFKVGIFKPLFLGELCGFAWHCISRFGKKKEVRVSAKAVRQKDL
jgi:hypothetical protein